MVFFSHSAYLDPTNWQQQQNHPTGTSSAASSHLLPPPPPPPPPPQPHMGGGGAGSIRPGSMADRGRMANIPMPETALKCPRCNSTNTKFCYFNNHSPTQPRHLCKTCRKYWTDGGALRNVPAGGGCRRNKRSKGSSSSKSPANSAGRQSASSIPSHSGAGDMIGLSSQVSQPRFMAPLHQFTGFPSSEIGLNYGLNYGHPMSTPMGLAGDSNFHLGNALGGSGGGGSHGSLLSAGGVEQSLLQQTQPFPFLGGLDPSLGFFESGVDAASGYVGASQGRAKQSNSVAAQMASAKMEDNQELNLSRQFLRIPAGSEQHWNGVDTGANNPEPVVTGVVGEIAPSVQVVEAQAGIPQTIRRVEGFFVPESGDTTMEEAPRVTVLDPSPELLAFLSRFNSPEFNSFPANHFYSFGPHLDNFLRFSVPVEGLPLLKRLFETRGDFTSGFSGGVYIGNIQMKLLCAVLLSLRDSTLDSLSEEKLLEWRGVVQDLIVAKFNLFFLMEYLHSLAYMLFQRQASRNLDAKIVAAKEALARAQKVLQDLEVRKQWVLSSSAIPAISPKSSLLDGLIP